jgi:hypothetical protein
VWKGDLMVKGSEKNGKKVRVVTSILPSQIALIDQMVGTIYGENRAEVIRFILMNWMHNNIESISIQLDRRKEYDSLKCK